MTYRSMRRKIKRGDNIRAALGYHQGDVWLVMRDEKEGWTSTNQATGEVIADQSLLKVVECMQAAGVRVFGCV